MGNNVWLLLLELPEKIARVEPGDHGLVLYLVLLASCGTYLLISHTGGRGRRIYEFEASFVYRTSSKPARDVIQRNIV